MFNNLTDKLNSALKILKGQGKITEINVAETLKEVRRALLEADVNFKTAKEFTINIKNLLTSEIITNTTTSTSVEITLTKGFPYSWQVISTNATSFVAESDKWKFYLSGEALKNHAPFPAEILTPKPGSSVSSGSVSLSWSFSDIDANDTHSFDLFLDQDEDSPATKKIISNYGARKRTVSLNTPGVYYWRVVTKDNHGTSSDSGISTFTVLE